MYDVMLRSPAPGRPSVPGRPNVMKKNGAPKLT
jgi:hypothetical protein